MRGIVLLARFPLALVQLLLGVQQGHGSLQLLLLRVVHASGLVRLIPSISRPLHWFSYLLVELKTCAAAAGHEQTSSSFASLIDCLSLTSAESRSDLMSVTCLSSSSTFADNARRSCEPFESRADSAGR